MKNQNNKQWLDLVTVGRRLSLDQGLRSQRENSKRHLSLNERIARRVRNLINRDCGLKAIQLPGVGYRVREDWLREYEIGLEMDAENLRMHPFCGQSDEVCSERRESPRDQTEEDSKVSNINNLPANERPQRPSSNAADHKSSNK